MKIAIHYRDTGFAPGWIEYCKSHNIDYKLVNAYDSDIIVQVQDCDAFMWHHHHSNEKDRVFAKQLLYSIEQSGKKVFPNFNSGWHFDDKLGQKYLLEGINAPFVPSYAFFDKDEALKWALTTTYPKVFKLRGGAGSSNVRLVKSHNDAVRLINRCFGKGFKELDLLKTLKYQWEKFRSGRITLRNMINFSIATTKNYISKVNNREHGYAYFQEFMPGNDFDYRIVVIAGKYAMGEKRYTRSGDFRASGSGKFDYSGIDTDAVKIAFNVAQKLGLQTVAFDFVYDANRNLKIVEMCYGFGTHGIMHAPGYWTEDLIWTEGSGFGFCGWMVEDLINNIKK